MDNENFIGNLALIVKTSVFLGMFLTNKKEPNKIE